MIDKSLLKQIDVLLDEAEKLEEYEEYNEALQKYNDAINLIPNKEIDHDVITFLYVSIAECLFHLDLYKDSLDSLLKAKSTTEGSNNEFIEFRIGQCYYHLNNKEEAKKHLTKAYSMDEELFEDEPLYLNFIK